MWLFRHPVGDCLDLCGRELATVASPDYEALQFNGQVGTGTAEVDELPSHKDMVTAEIVLQ